MTAWAMYCDQSRRRADMTANVQNGAPSGVSALVSSSVCVRVWATETSVISGSFRIQWYNRLVVKTCFPLHAAGSWCMKPSLSTCVCAWRCTDSGNVCRIRVELDFVSRSVYLHFCEEISCVR